MNFTLDQEEYEALIALARKGTFNENGQVIADKARQLDAWLRKIEKENGVTRSFVWIQWQEVDTPVPTTASFPETWPPHLRYYLEMISRPVNKDDVQKVLQQKARKPVTVLVTRDPGAQVGWTTIDALFAQ